MQFNSSPVNHFKLDAESLASLVFHNNPVAVAVSALWAELRPKQQISLLDVTIIVLLHWNIIVIWIQNILTKPVSKLRALK